MTLAGGPANKRGNRYETLWTVSECIRMLRGDTDSIRIEEPGVDKAEFVVRTGQRRELHQVKRSHPSGKWSLATLASGGFLQEIGSEVASESDRFVFVSGSDARELADLCEAANDAASAEEFAGKFLKPSKERRASFDRLLNEWQCRRRAAVDRLCRISVHVIDEGELREKVLWGFQALFLDRPRNLLDATRALVEDSVHRTLHREDLIGHLSELRYRLRRLQNPENAPLAVQEATDAHYLDAARRQLIRRTLVSREAQQALLSRLSDAATDSVVTGKAGTGKTAYIVGITEALRSRGWPVLPLRLDRVDFNYISTTDRLGKSLDLEESPALVLGAAAEAAACPGVLIIDQLDAIGNASGRSTAAFEMVEALLHEARGQRPSVVIHTVVVCRSFDWQNDHLLRRLLPSDSSEPVEVAEFGVDQAKEILIEADFDVTLFSGRQLELLRLPENLALFLEAGVDQPHVRDFKTVKELLDRYWDKKRRRVREWTSPALDVHWVDVIRTLCDQMTTAQQLSVPKERLDKYPTLYVDQLASEGVITIDEHRCGFGHESFFDYCFARLFVDRDDRLIGFLKKSEQHLFRRAQVRQVLTYLRDADHGRYIDELRALLADGEIRTHIKDLAIALLAEAAEPTDEEWQVRTQLVAPALKALEGGTANPDQLSDLAWRRFFNSQSWFDTTCQRGLIKDWLASGSDALADAAVNYLSWHARHAPDQAAALLEPYGDCGGDWPRRLLWIAASLHASRGIFNFGLQLIDNGAFDEVHEFFARILYRLDEKHPEWFAEALGQWMRRRLSVSQEAEHALTERHLFGGDTGAIIRAGETAPAAFVDHILPIVLDISDFCAKGQVPPKQDAVWGHLSKTDYPSGTDACLSALADALAATAHEGNDLRKAISALRVRDTHVANHLLLALYRGAASKFADQAVGLLCEQPWRLECGYIDSPYWCGRETIRAVVPHCSAESRSRLERMVLEYVSPRERTKGGFKYTGWSRFGLLSAFPAEWRSQSANAHIKELKRKYGEPEGAPTGGEGGIVGSPIGADATARMTDEQWLRAIDKYDSEARLSLIDRLKGGASELAYALQGRVEEEPERFAKLSLKFAVEANPVYLACTLSGLKESDVSTDLKLRVCRKACHDAFEHCGSSIAGVLGAIKGPLPEEAVQMLDRLAVESKDPSEDDLQQKADGGTPPDIRDLEFNAINTTRGRVADAIRDLIHADPSHVDRFRPTLERMACDRSPLFLCCVTDTINAVTYSDADFGIRLFKSMDLSDDRLFATRPLVDFLRRRLHDDLVDIRPIIERMIRSSVPDVCQAGARLAGLAVLTGHEAEHLVDEALRGSVHHRRGLVQVAAANVALPACRDWCEDLLPTLFNDEDEEVRREAASCFRQLEDTALETYGALIREFGESRAFQDHSYDLLHALEGSLERLPGLTCEICAKLASHDTELRRVDTRTIVRLPFRVYQQHQDDEWTTKALDLIDLLCLNGGTDLAQEFEDFER